MVHIALTDYVVHDAQKLYKLVRLFICCKPRQIIIDTSIIDLNTKLVLVYYNKGKSNLLRVRNDVTLFGLKDQLDKINRRLNNKDTRRVDNVEYRRPSTESDVNVHFT